MAHHDRNRRTAGYTRVSAVRERMRMKDGLSPLAADELAQHTHDSTEALVLLMRDVPAITPEEVRAAADSVLGEILTEDMEAEEMAATTGAIAVVCNGGWAIGVRADTGSYFADADAVADGVPELRLRTAVRGHGGFLAVELYAAPREVAPEDRLRVIGRVLAALAPNDTAALYHPDSGRVGLFTPQATAALTDGRVDDAFRPTDHPVPIAGVDGDDPRMAAAAAEANRRLGEFLTAFAARRPDDTFAVKVPFADSAGLEYMWVSVTAVDDAEFVGRLDNQPAFVRTFRVGQTVRVSRADLNDWLYVRGGKLHGGFTLRLLGDRLRHDGHRRGEAA